MAGQSTPVLLVTANVGSIFEDPSLMLKLWTEEFLSTISRLDPKFIALHCQEVGGKNYERSMKHVEYFVRLLMSSEELRLFDKVRVYLDEDYSSAENFTALGNFYFIHESMSDVLIWDFSAMGFISAKGKEVHSGNIEAVSTKEKSKFPQDFFPECKWSRKGFLRTRWSLNGTVFDLINIHLFHDASNFIAVESFPSVYCKNRRRALEHTLDRFHNDDYGTAPFFVFGDFNFRTDAQGVVKKLAEGLNPVRLQSNKSTDHTKLQYRDGTSQVILSLGKKEFSHQDHQTVFIEENGKWLREFDLELEPFADRLYEFPISFPPSYPFEEDRKGAECYMQTRCPSWCDRVLLSNSAKSLTSNINEPGSVQYGLMGAGTCMGDHKPVYLKVSLDSDAGMVPCCCNTESSPCFGLYLPADARVSPPQWPKSHTQHSSKLDHAALSSMLLAARCTTVTPVAAGSDSHLLLPPSAHASLLHDPYTPESMETPSSSPTPSMIPQFEFPDDYERESDANLKIYGPAPSTKDKIYGWDFVVSDSVEQSDSSDEELRVDDKKDAVSICSSCKEEETGKNVRSDSQEMQQIGSQYKNETLLLTEKLLLGSCRKIFPSSSMEVMQIGDFSKNRDSVLIPSHATEDEVSKQESVASDSTSQFQVPDIIEEKCESYSSLDRCSISYNKAVKAVKSEEVPVSKTLCFCDNVHNNTNKSNKLVTLSANAECRETDQFAALSCSAGRVQNNSQVKGNNKSVQIISGFSTEAQDMLPLCQDHHGDDDDDDDDIDSQVLSQNIPALVLETEIKSDTIVEMAQKFASLSPCESSFILNPGMTQSALEVESHTDTKYPHSFHKVQSCIAECNKSAALGHSLSHETSNPGSSNPVMTNMHATNKSPFPISDSSDKIRYFLAVNNSVLSSESTNSIENHKLRSCNNCKEQPQNHTSEDRMLPCNKVFVISRLLPMSNMISKFKNKPVTVHNSSLKNLFRSVSVPVNIYSSRILEKQVPCLFTVLRTLSCGNITSSCNIEDLTVYPNGLFESCEKSALKQEPHTEQNNSISSACGSVIDAPVDCKQEKKHDKQSSSDVKCFSCCILL